MKNSITELFKIRYPIIQAGMVWCSGWRLAAAVSNTGGLGLIGSASMHPDILREHIRKCKYATASPFGVNVPLMYTTVEEQMKVILEEKVKIVFTSAGNPARWTGVLKNEGVTVVHVVSSLKFALKSAESGVDAIVAEGFEAGGHNGREETTTLCLVPLIRKNIPLPLIAAGGISSGQAMLAVMALGADGVQIGTRFAASLESSAHDNFKKKIIELTEGETQLSLKKLVPVRIVKNKFYDQIFLAENEGAGAKELSSILGHGRSKLGMFEGNLDMGELEVGQISALIDSIKPAAQIVDDIWLEYLETRERICKSS